VNTNIDRVEVALKNARANGISDERLVRAINALSKTGEINPFTPGQTLAEFQIEEEITQYDLAWIFDYSQGAVQKMLKSEYAKKRNFVVQQDLKVKPRRIYLLEWSVNASGVIPWES
tara:strand:- start:480 stop:830 length:351 start_codon:yes stop_codon:yes gene_type:complete